MSYLDVSFLDPYDYWKKASGALMRSLTARNDAEAMERITRGAMEAASELIRPFKSEQLVSGAVTEILRNQDSAGRQIYNPQDTGANIAAKTTERLWKAFSPGAFDTGARIIKAGVGDVSDSGRAYNLANELHGLAAGQRITEVNVEAALGFKASKFSRDIKNLNQWPPGGWNYEEPSTGFRFKGSSLQDLAAKVKLHREVNYLGREDRVEEDIQEQIILKAPEEFDGWEEG